MGNRVLKCWYNQSTEWKPCPRQCGFESLRFDPGYAYQEDGTSYPPVCTTAGLPAGSLVIDDLPDGTPSVRPNCGRPWTNAGDFTLDFADDGNGMRTSKVDFHQIGAGFGGHFWFAHTRQDTAEGRKMRVTGTWRLDRPLDGWARVLVHLPDHGAHTQQARYRIGLGDGQVRDRYLSQGVEANRWVSAGVYRFSGVPDVQLSTITKDGFGEEDVAWDAVAFQPLPGKPQHLVAALGDSYSSGEGYGGYFRETDTNHGKDRWNACRRGTNAWPRTMTLPGAGAPLGSLSDGFGPNSELGFVACSGATSWNMRGYRPRSWDEPQKYEYGEGQFREISQLESGVLDGNTTLVTLTVGGNDRNGFTGALTECATSGCGPASEEEFLAKYRGIVDANQADIRDTLLKVRSAADHAKILLVGYPRLVGTTSNCGLATLLIDPWEARTLASLADYMAYRQNQTVQELKALGVPVDYVRVLDRFIGHGACDSGEWINGFSAGPRGDGDFHQGDRTVVPCFWQGAGGACLSRESFHPNQSGVRAYAQAVEEQLRLMNYQGG